MANTSRLRQRRRLLLVAAAFLVTLEVSGALVTTAATAQATLNAREAMRPVVVPRIEVSGTQSGRAPSPWLRLSAEQPSTDLRVWRTVPVRNADLWFDPPAPAAPAPTPEPAPTPAPLPTPTPTPANAGSGTTAAAGGLAGAGRTAAVVTNRFRFPDLGIDRTTRSYPCDRAEPPDNYVYRWGCAGRNNLYLLGHAHTVFKPLHDAYAAGRLRVGMRASYTDSYGRTRTYRVTTWRVVWPTDVTWAIASQPVPSMTLQTCYGRYSEFRLLVRLVAI
jgi:hypothetical protein